MTATAKCFVSLVKGICWTKGWGTTGTTERFPALDIEESKSLEWLEENGYIFHYVRDEYDKHRNWRYAHRTAHRYGITKKGWGVAKKFILASGEELRYQYDSYPKMPE